MKKSVMNAKATAIATIEAAENIRKSMSYAEEMLVNSIIFQGVEDKDAEDEMMEETEMVYIPNSGWQKQKTYSKKNNLKDKAKHGYHCGSARQGEGRYDYFGKDVKLVRDQKLDLKDQLADLNSIDTASMTAYEVYIELMTYISDLDIYQDGMARVFYHYGADFKSMVEWANLIDQFKDWMEGVISTIVTNLYDVADECYPDVAFSVRNEAVELVSIQLKADLADTLQSMMDYCVRNWKKENFKEF